MHKSFSETLKRSFGAHDHKSEGKIKADLKKAVSNAVGLVHVVQDTDQWRALAKTAIILFQSSGKFLD